MGNTGMACNPSAENRRQMTKSATHHGWGSHLPTRAYRQTENPTTRSTSPPLNEVTPNNDIAIGKDHDDEGGGGQGGLNANVLNDMEAEGTHERHSRASPPATC